MAGRPRCVFVRENGSFARRFVRVTVRPKPAWERTTYNHLDERFNSALHVRSCTESSVCARPKHSHPRERVTSALLLRCFKACGRENAPRITKVIDKVGGVGKHYALAVCSFATLQAWQGTTRDLRITLAFALRSSRFGSALCTASVKQEQLCALPLCSFTKRRPWNAIHVLTPKHQASWQ